MPQHTDVDGSATQPSSPRPEDPLNDESPPDAEPKQDDEPIAAFSKEVGTALGTTAGQLLSATAGTRIATALKTVHDRPKSSNDYIATLTIGSVVFGFFVAFVLCVSLSMAYKGWLERVLHRQQHQHTDQTNEIQRLRATLDRCKMATTFFAVMLFLFLNLLQIWLGAEG
eukprot:m.462370 g.462370  ORF g.462370 m.462370 type:complete len:170 (-) comp22624_c0_seq1:63-572(-)